MVSPRVKRIRIILLVVGVILVSTIIHTTASPNYKELLTFDSPFSLYSNRLTGQGKSQDDSGTQEDDNVLKPEDESHKNKFGEAAFGGDDAAHDLGGNGKLVKDSVSLLAKILAEAKPTSAPLVKYNNDEKAAELFHTNEDFHFSEEYLSHLLVVDDDTVKDLTKKHQLFVQKAFVDNKFPVFGDSKKTASGRGIVIVGGGDYNWLTLLNINQLRTTGCTLPVEVYIANADDYEKAFCDEILPELNAKCVLGHKEIPSGLRNSEAISGFQYKLYAFFASSFQEILFLDSDNVVVRDPTPMFDSKPYLKTGLVLWPDCWSRTTHPKYYSIAGIKVGDKPDRGQFKNEKDPRNWNYHDLPGTLPNPASETGMIILDKKRQVQTLLLALYYNFYGPDFYYPLLTQGGAGEGDKDTFPAAAHALAQPYYQVKAPFSFIGYHDSEGFHSKALGHYDPGQDYSKFLSKDKKEKEKELDLMFMHLSYPKLFPYTLDLELKAENGDQRRLYLSSTEKSGYDFELQMWNIFTQLLCEDYKLDKKTSSLELSERMRSKARKLKVAQKSDAKQACSSLHLPHLKHLRANPEK
ncbi:unnamed protein product [Kuraishia capsulata CBS 1993]|uniref:Glycosyltransferase family 71 protein n=1 Tax=Kuraishia capsulata CBS 1993 TaxID=1382522 RepID=W6MII5_9ASCO|nr:uncharacterized protein KUCA_T00001688001 [Kuraishia capsulata CBS 1993]CDK25718.1 unnamed protein product [Kuraishia capsulata CBS 1993]